MRFLYILAASLMLACGTGREAIDKDVSITAEAIPEKDSISQSDGGKPDVPPDPVDVIDIAVPPDINPPDVVEDIPADLPEPPAGCCLTDADCPLSESGEPMTCVTDESVGWPQDFGVCIGPPSKEGWCFDSSQCPDGQICHGSAVCGCQMDCYWEGPGICVPADGSCAPIEESWVEETCNAASIVIFNGENCVATCPGCCGCSQFCEYTFETIQQCEYACLNGTCAKWDGGCDDAIPENPWWYFDGYSCVSEDSCMCDGCPGVFQTKEACKEACFGISCPPYIGALAESPYGYFAPLGECPQALELPEWCAGDEDCPIPVPSPGEPGNFCVFGNCVYCWEDTQCDPWELCRAGRCVPNNLAGCHTAVCAQEGCKLVNVSEKPCPVCVCESFYPYGCSVDAQCQNFSVFPFKHCVYGRCAECRTDSECNYGRCLPPGICYEMTPNVDYLYGSWLIGWAGGMDHFSYFRFEPDGSLRRGSYAEGGAWADDIPGLPCWPDGVIPYPLIGTWEPEVTESGFLIIRARLNISCDPGEGWTARLAVYPSDDGISATFDDIDNDGEYMAWRVPTEACTPDFSTCEEPVGP